MIGIKTKIRTIPHYPKQGIMFRNITTLLKDAVGLRIMLNELVHRYTGQRIDKVVGIESRGFILGAPLAYALGSGLIPIRKKGKLPAETVGCDYEPECGVDRIEIHTDAIAPGERVLLVYDLIATAGTAKAAAQLIRRLSGEVVECAFAIDLPEIGGARRVEQLGVPVFALASFEGH